MDKSLKFSKDDVRGHLAELGYSNIDDDKLDDFCQDLRRLIKYEEKKKTIGRKLEQLETFEQNMSENKENEDTSSSEHVPKVLLFSIYVCVIQSNVLFSRENGEFGRKKSGG